MINGQPGQSNFTASLHGIDLGSRYPLLKHQLVRAASKLLQYIAVYANVRSDTKKENPHRFGGETYRMKEVVTTR
jgi:hypothetical protein